MITTRRAFLKGLGAGSAALTIPNGLFAAGAPERPNLLFLLEDHQLHYRHGWDGGPRIQRPVFDRFAGEGMLFTRAYTACPLCQPARRGMLTGLLPHNHGALTNGPAGPYTRELYLDRLAAAGYRCAYFGKWHAGPGTAHDHFCEGFSFPSYGNPYDKPAYRQYLQRNHLPDPEIKVVRGFGAGQPQRIGSNGLYCGTLETPKETHESFFLASLACDTLRELKRSAQPWALRVDFWGPHQPYLPAREFVEKYRPGEIPEYGSFADDLKGKPDTYRSESIPAISRDGRLIQPSPIPWSDWQKVLALAYAQSTMMDAAAGRVLQMLAELGLAENTLVVWTADHGDACASHGGHFDKDAYLPEEVMRIPMALRWPGRIAPRQTSDRLVSNMDVPPTLMDAAGLRFDRPVDGASLLPLARGDAAGWRDDLMCETHGHRTKAVGRVLLAGRHKYVATAGQTHELYDLEADPYELHNLAGSAAHAGTLAEMKGRLAQWQRRSGDQADVSA